MIAERGKVTMQVPVSRSTFGKSVTFLTRRAFIGTRGYWPGRSEEECWYD